MKAFLPVFLLLLTVSSFGQERHTNEDVITMVKSGLSPEIISAKIRTGDSDFDVSTDGLKKLSDAKVPDSVIVSMIERDGKNKQVQKVETKEVNDANNAFPEQGTLADIKGKSKVYVMTDDLKARDKIVKELKKKTTFEVVDSIEGSDFAMKFSSWIETVGVVANVYGSTATAQPSQVRVGVLTVVMSSSKANRLRLVYSNKQTQRFVWTDHPAASTTKEFLKAYGKLP